MDHKKVVKCLMQITRGDGRFNVDKCKEELFVAMSKIVLKGINNFFSLLRKNEYPEGRIIHTEEDIMNECWIVLDNCIANLKIDKIKYFSFYYNSALNRYMFRYFKKNYMKSSSTIENTDENEKYILNNLPSKTHTDTLSIDLSKFTELELEVINFKHSGGKLKEFLAANDARKAIASQDYYAALESVKRKLISLYANDIFTPEEIENKRQLLFVEKEKRVLDNVDALRLTSEEENILRKQFNDRTVQVKRNAQSLTKHLKEIEHGTKNAPKRIGTDRSGNKPCKHTGNRKR